MCSKSLGHITTSLVFPPPVILNNNNNNNKSNQNVNKYINQRNMGDVRL